MKFLIVVIAGIVMASISLSAQITATGPVVYGHHHLIVTNIDAHKRFWVDTLGGVPAKLGASAVNVVALPNVLIVLTPGQPGGGTKGTTVGSFVAADLPGVNLSFSPAPAAVVGTRGRVLDHVRVEIRGLEAFVKNAESSGAKMGRGYVKAAQYGDLGIAFLTDPWGTYIELNEGLTAVR